ncbi:MAG TPA: lytic transglycosylase domain-containing protein [Flavisolibacter sp.]|nr:lytic transglycosylase domain-containing protein [Flavisolibacter sp.]
MLKRNLVKTGFVGHGFLLLLPNVAAVKSEPLVATKEVRARLVSSEWRTADTLIVQQIIDSAAAPLKADTVMAPQIELNKNAVKFVKGFLKKEDESLRKVRERSRTYFKLIDTVLSKYGLPLELKYLAVIESELKATAVSRVGAKGMWQLMPTTARELGLKITKKYDERTNVYRSTVAAAKYLKALHAEFGDWLLVIAAYNGGPGTVYNAIRKAGTRNFWALQAHLPMESRAHVKRYIGAHYYFEGKGSLTTLTRSESLAYARAVANFQAASLDPAAKDSTDALAATVR